jgi:putative flavoprotein involved in K+ transport
VFPLLAEPRKPERHDTLIVGAGQAGLAMSAVLQRHGREHVVLERRRVGEGWRTERWDSLRFQFPNWSLQLPGWRYQGGEPDGFAHCAEIVRIIEDYAASTRAPVSEHIEVVGLRQDGAGAGFVLSLAGGSIRARRVVLATGPFQRPRIPPMSHGVSPSVLRTDPARYWCPEQLPSGAVLVVGSGASGCQIADELLRAGRTVFLSVSRHRRIPRRYRGRDVCWWLEKMGRFAQTIDSVPGRQWPPSIVVTGVGRRLRRQRAAARRQRGCAWSAGSPAHPAAGSPSRPTRIRSSTRPTPPVTASCRPRASSPP